MPSEKTPQEIADALTEKALCEIDNLIKSFSDYARNITCFRRCPKNPLEISECDNRVKEIQLILSTAKRAKDYLTFVSVNLDHLVNPMDTQIKDGVTKEITSRINLINAYESIGKTYQDLCPLSQGKNCGKYKSKL